jgi:hypothetical protein
MRIWPSRGYENKNKNALCFYVISMLFLKAKVTYIHDYNIGKNNFKDKIKQFKLL